MVAALEKVVSGDLCSGCGLCAGISNGSVAMQTSPEGQLRPFERAPVSDELDAKIDATCPGLSLSQNRGDRPDHVIWGPIKAVEQGYSKDPALRHGASSGGAISSLLQYLLESGRADFVINTSADLNIPYGNRTVLSRSTEDIFESAGSRYAPSAPLSNIDSILSKGQRFVFVGKPCDVAALAAYARLDERVERLVTCTISFFCAGVPSLEGAETIIRAMGVAPQDVRRFRYRGDGWPGFAKAETLAGGEHKMSYNESWGKILTQFLPFRCKICPDGTGGFADIVCADAWDCDEKGFPVFSEKEGVSLILSRTSRGEEIVAAAKSAGMIFSEACDIEKISSMQPGQLKRKRLVASRLLAVALTGRPAPKFTGFNLKQAAAQAGVVANVRSLLGTARRIIQARFRSTLVSRAKAEDEGANNQKKDQTRRAEHQC